MSNFAIEGLISGFDTTALIEATVDIQYGGLINEAESNIAIETEKLTAFQAVNANLLNLEISSSSLKSSSLFDNKQITSSNESMVAASVSSSAAVGNFGIRVDNLAKSDQISSSIFVSSADELNYDGQFVINGRTISVSAEDSLQTMATQINASNTGVRASVVQLAPNQNKLVLGATTTGVDKIELREVGNDNILSDLGLITSDSTDISFDRTVNADNMGALGDKLAVGWNQTYTGESFTVSDAGGQYSISVTLNAANMTLQDIADEINLASTGAGANISASVIMEDGDERLRIESSTGIPQTFTDPDNVLFDLGVLGGVQSSALSSSSTAVGNLMNLDATSTSTITLEDGDGSDSFNVDIDLDTDSLQDIVERINTESTAAGADVSAQVISADGVYRIELNSTTGRIGVLADSQGALQTLGIADRTFTNIDQVGENAQLTYNGITVNRFNNVVTDLVEGVSLALINEGTEIVNVNVSEDLSNVTEIVQGFVDAYNTLSNFVGEQTFYDSDSGKHGVLFGNSTMRELESALANGVSRSIPNLPGVEVSELNDGMGIDLGSILITDRTGSSATIDLNTVSTVQDIIDAINYSEDIEVSAEISTSGTSINLNDSSGGVGIFKVEEVNGGTTAEDLGLKKNMFSDHLAGSSIHTSASQSLDSIGISLTAAGTLSFNSGELQSLLNSDPDKVKNLIQADGVGFGEYFSDILKDFTSYDVGRINTASQAVQSKIELYSNQITRYEERSESMEATLRKKYTALEVTLAQSQQVSQLLSSKLESNY